MLKTTRSSVASASRVNDNKVVGDSGAEAESDKSIIERKVGSIVCNHPEYTEDKKDVHLSFRPQKAGLIAKETFTNVLAKYADFANVFFFILESMIMLSSWSMDSNHPIGPSIA